LQVLYTIRSERMLMVQLDYNLLFRRFAGLSMEDKVWDHSVFSKNQERRSDLVAAFLRRIKGGTALFGLLLDENFTVDGTLIEVWASLKSLRPKDAQPPEAGGDRRPEPDYIAQPQGHIRLHNPVAIISLPEEDSKSVTA
jgi:hypothetical protein